MYYFEDLNNYFLKEGVFVLLLSVTVKASKPRVRIREVGLAGKKAARWQRKNTSQSQK